MPYFILLSLILVVCATFVTYFIKTAQKPQIQANYLDSEYVPVMKKTEILILFDSLYSIIETELEDISEILNLDVLEKQEYTTLFKFSDKGNDTVYFDEEKANIISSSNTNN